ncbi:DUF4377 domain-containing protein [Flavobacteriaceae bacterium F08102]|nr:DUF4377 domain-containing protein [Flavobacteriaceae bacterium F08102]
MKKISLLLCLLSMIFISSCSLNDDEDRQETVLLTIYPETGIGAYFMSNTTYGEFLVFSENGGTAKYLLNNGTASFDDFTYEKGTKYTVEAIKTWLANPPADGSFIQYDYMSTISSEKVVTEDSEEEITIEVGPEIVDFIPMEEDEARQVMLIKEDGNPNSIPVEEIEGFNYEEGLKYTLLVKKEVQADPYLVAYSFLELISIEEN